MPLTAEDVKNRQFSSTRFGRGYDEKEVDDFLDEVEAEITRLTRENSDLRTRLQLAEQSARSLPPAMPTPASAPVEPAYVAPPAPQVSAPVPPPMPAPTPVPVPVASDTANEQALRMLTMAQRTADETIGEARRDADKLLAKARQDADQLEREVKEQHRAAVGNLESERERLERKIDELRSFEREYRARLKSYLEGQLRDLDGTAAPTARAGVPVTPSAAPTVRPPMPAPVGASMNGPGSAPGRAPLFAPVSAPPVPGTPVNNSSGLTVDPAGPPRQAPTGGFEIEDGPEVPPNHS
jgi:DivIVA domain-containing protein